MKITSTQQKQNRETARRLFKQLNIEDVQAEILDKTTDFETFDKIIVINNEDVSISDILVGINFDPNSMLVSRIGIYNKSSNPLYHHSNNNNNTQKFELSSTTIHTDIERNFTWEQIGENIVGHVLKNGKRTLIDKNLDVLWTEE